MSQPASPGSAPAQPQSFGQRLHRAGFIVPTLVFALRTAGAAFAALVLSYALGLEHPHWAAMSAWACSQPTREHLFSRGLYRFGGSIVGVAYAVFLVWFAQESIWVLAMGLALWGAACAFIGNLQRGFLVYGCMLAGYSAAMVVLLHHGPVAAIWDFATDRMLTVLAGVVCAVGISWFFSPRRQPAVLISRQRQAMALVLQACASELRRQAKPAEHQSVHLQAALAQTEELLDLYAEGSRTAARTAQALRWQQHHALELVYQMDLAQAQPAEPAAATAEPAPVPPEAEPLAESLQALASVLREPPSVAPDAVQRMEAALQAARTQCQRLAERLGQQLPAEAMRGAEGDRSRLLALHTLLQTLQDTAPAEQADLGRLAGNARAAFPSPRSGASSAPARRPVVLRDWVGARHAGIRAGSVLLVVGTVWALTGSQVVSFGMLGLSVMLLVFSSFENPQRTMAFVLRGQLIGAVLAMVCLFAVWPWAHSGWAMVWMLLPFTLAGALLFGHRRTAAGALDTNMVMFILLAPSFPYALDPLHSLSMAIAVVCGPAMAWWVYGTVFPTDARRRMHSLALQLAAQVPLHARSLLAEPGAFTGLRQRGAFGTRPPADAGDPADARARQHHGLLRLMRWADKAPMADPHQVAHFGVALRFVESSMAELSVWSQGPHANGAALRRARRLAHLTLRHMARWSPHPALGTQVAEDKAIRAWKMLARQPNVPPRLAAQAEQVAATHLPALRLAP